MVRAQGRAKPESRCYRVGCQPQVFRQFVFIRQPSTVRHHASNVSRQTSTVICQSSSVNYQLSAVKHQLSAVSRQLSVVTHQLSAVGHQLSAVSRQLPPSLTVSSHPSVTSPGQQPADPALSCGRPEQDRWLPVPADHELTPPARVGRRVNQRALFSGDHEPVGRRRE